MSNYQGSTNNYFKQKFSAIAIALFTILVFLAFINIDVNKYYLSFKGFDSIFLLLSINLICIYHGCLGFKVIIEDYIKNIVMRERLIFLLNCFSWLSITVSIFLIIYIFIIHLDCGVTNPSFFKFLISTLSIITFLYLSLGKRNFLYFILIVPLFGSLSIMEQGNIGGSFIMSGLSLTFFFTILYHIKSIVASKNPDSLFILLIYIIIFCVILANLFLMLFLLMVAGMTGGMSIVSFFVGILEIFVFIYISLKLILN